MRPGVVDGVAGRDHLVDDAILPGLLGRHHEVAVGVLVDPLDRLAGVAGDDLLQEVAHAQDLLGRQLDVGGLRVAGGAVGLVEQDPGVGQGEALALGARGQQHRGGRRRLAEADRGDVVADELQSCRRSRTAR